MFNLTNLQGKVNQIELKDGEFFIFKGRQQVLIRLQEIQTVMYCTCGFNMVQPFWKTFRKFPKMFFKKKLNIELSQELAIQLLCIIKKILKICTPKFIAALFTIIKCWKQPSCPSVNEWIKKLWYIYVMEYQAAERKKELLPFVTAWMELESILLSEISQTATDKYHIISPISGT